MQGFPQRGLVISASPGGQVGDAVQRPDAQIREVELTGDLDGTGDVERHAVGIDGPTTARVQTAELLSTPERLEQVPRPPIGRDRLGSAAQPPHHRAEAGFGRPLTQLVAGFAP